MQLLKVIVIYIIFDGLFLYNLVSVIGSLSCWWWFSRTWFSIVMHLDLSDLIHGLCLAKTLNGQLQNG